MDIEKVNDKPTEDLRYLKLDQTTPQSVINGIPIFSSGIGGSIDSGGNLTLQSTAHATKGKILFGTSAYDEVNNRLGIGTTSPSNNLDVSFSNSGSDSNGINITNTFNAGYGGGYGIRLTSGGVLYTASRLYSENDGTGGFLRFQTADTSQVLQNRMTIKNNGNVGIGTTTPLAKLNISGSAGVGPEQTAIVFSDTANSNSRTWAIGSVSGINYGALAFIVGSGQNISPFVGGNIEAMTILKTGNVGIGTTSPSGRLDVHGAGTTTGVTFQTADSGGNAKFTVLDNGAISAVNQITSTLAIGTSPFAVTSTTVNTNLNADLWDGKNLVTGSGTLTAGTTTTVTIAGATATSIIMIEATSAAFTVLGVYVSAKNAGNFVLTHTLAVGGEAFDYIIVA